MSGQDSGLPEAGPSRPGWHTVSMRIPFYTSEHAVAAKRALEVDKEQNAQFVHRTIEAQDSDLVVHYSASTVRLLRLATNSFLSSVDLILRTMEEFAPDPAKEMTDEQLEEDRRIANAGNTQGIELKGDGRGAGSGEEVTT